MSLFAEGGARAGERGRIPGGLYIEVGVDTWALQGRRTFDRLITDPAQPWAGERVNPRGVMIISLQGVSHVIDVVGSEHYPTPADFIEESFLKGISRRVNPGLDFTGLDPSRSKIIFLHGKGVVKNLAELYAGGLERMVDSWGTALQDGASWVMPQVCPRAVFGSPHGPGHNHRRAECAGVHWLIHTPNDGEGRRRIGNITYPVFYKSGYLEVNPEYALGVIAIFPISGFSVIDSPGSRDADHVYSRLRGTHYPINRTGE